MQCICSDVYLTISTPLLLIRRFCPDLATTSEGGFQRLCIRPQLSMIEVLRVYHLTLMLTGKISVPVPVGAACQSQTAHSTAPKSGEAKPLTSATLRK
jgi:hypothetical protein